MRRRQNRRKMFKGETHKFWTYIHNSRYSFFRRVLFEVNARARVIIYDWNILWCVVLNKIFFNPTYINDPESLKRHEIRNMFL